MGSGHQVDRSQHPLARRGPGDVLAIEPIGFLERTGHAEDDLHLAFSVAHVPADRQEPVEMRSRGLAQGRRTPFL
jgi:hypothetical protein